MGSPKQRPLMLKDYLREDQNFDSRGGFPLTTTGERTVRRLLDLELGGCRLTRSRSKGTTLTRISAFFNAVKSLAVANSPPKGPMQGILQRSFSRKLLPKTLWRRRCSRREERGHLEDIKNRFIAGKILIKDVIRLESFVDEKRGGRSVLSPPHPSSPVGSSRNSCSCSTSGWSEMESSSGGDSLPSLSSPVPDFPTKRNTLPDKNIRPNSLISTSPKKDEIEEEDAEDRVAGRDYEEKEQLSPVSVMDFPYEEEEEVASETAEASPSFQHSLASIERTKTELLKKIRRFESLALLVDPVDLDDAFSEGSDEHVDGADELESIEIDEVRIRARELVDEITLRCSAGTTEHSSQELLLEFFSQGLRDSITDDRTVQERLLRAAREWTDGTVSKDVASREALMREMDSNGRWICGNEVDEGVGADLEVEVLGSLLEELMEELFLD